MISNFDECDNIESGAINLYLGVLMIWGHSRADKTKWCWQPIYDVHFCLVSKLFEKLRVQ